MDAELSEMLTSRCSRHVVRVEADYNSRKEFSYSCSIRMGTAKASLPDYLRGCPDEVLCDFGEMMVRRALGRRVPFPESVLRTMASDMFVNTRRPTYIARSRNLTRSDIGRHAFIPDSIQRLLDSGLLTPRNIDNSWFSWTVRGNRRELGACSPIFRVVSVSSILDSPQVPDRLRDYVVYHECLHLRQGFRPGRRAHDDQFHAWEAEFPDLRGCRDDLRRLCGDPTILSDRRHPGCMERRGFVFHGTDGEAVLSLEQVEALAEEGDPEGTYALAMAYLFGWDAEADPDRGYELLERAVDLGNTEAMALMVRLFMQGDYDGIDSDRAASMAVRAAEDGVRDAYLYAGMAYLDGIGVERDPARAARYLRGAANSGDQEARTLLAHMYQNGIGVERDEAKAFTMFRAAAEAGCANAMFQTAVCLEYGVGTREDLEGAEAWYLRCAEAGDPGCYERVGMIAFDRGDAGRGFEMTLRAALGGVVTAMYTVGMCYRTGLGTDPDEKEAAKWLRMAADNGLDEASEALDGDGGTATSFYDADD